MISVVLVFGVYSVVYTDVRVVLLGGVNTSEVPDKGM